MKSFMNWWINKMNKSKKDRLVSFINNHENLWEALYKSFILLVIIFVCLLCIYFFPILAEIIFNVFVILAMIVLLALSFSWLVLGE
jgi:hypothetical protein